METEPGELPPPPSGDAAPAAADAAAAAASDAKAPDTPMREPPLPDDPIEDELRTLVPMVPHILSNPMPSLRCIGADARCTDTARALTCRARNVAYRCGVASASYYVTFWALSLHDIYVPEDRYKDQAAKLRATARQLEAQIADSRGSGREATQVRPYA